VLSPIDAVLIVRSPPMDLATSREVTQAADTMGARSAISRLQQVYTANEPELVQPVRTALLDYLEDRFESYQRSPRFADRLSRVVDQMVNRDDQDRNWFAARGRPVSP
jgi:hypothetical protein